jgi:transposase
MLRLTKDFGNKLSTFGDDQVVCLDETGFCNVGYVSYGYFPKGKQPTALRVRRRERYSVIAAIHPSEGILLTRMQQTAYNKTTFLSFIEDLLPVLPSTVKAIIMDNVSFHRSNIIRERLGKQGIEALYIPPYSPRCNPIEEVFSLVKHKYKTSYDLTFTNKVRDALDFVKNSYKDFSVFYRHTRNHVAECLGWSKERPLVFSSPKTFI